MTKQITIQKINYTMTLPKFLLADNSNFPDDIFVLHTEYPRFLINLKDDSVEWFEDLSGEREDDIATELADLMDKAGEFYDNEMKGFELCSLTI
jgi:hypothetical protein